MCMGLAGHRSSRRLRTRRGAGESSAVSNVLWGFGNVVVGLVLLHFFWPWGATEWVVLAAGALAMSIQLVLHFGRAAKT